MIKQLKSSNTFIRYRYWEYWPMWLAYLPVLPVVLFYALRARRFFFFSNVNPIFKTGALLGASKFDILHQIPDQYKPISILNKNLPNRYSAAVADIERRGLKFPIILKPDIGERALLVELIDNKEELRNYLQANDIDIIIQEYISLPQECGIFYIRKPSAKKGKVVSIGLKSFLKLKGDGKKSVRELMMLNSRYILQIERFEKDKLYLLNKIPDEDEVLELEPIGNHCRGTSFIDGNRLICSKLDELFDHINMQMNEVYYGRFDIKYNSWDELLEGKNIKILELNGVASEPIHIYDQSVPITEKYKSFYSLWKTIFEISNIQKERGVDPMKSFVAFRAIREYKNYLKSINSNWRNNSPAKFSIS